MKDEMNSLSSSDKLKYVNDLNNNVICANIATTNHMYQAMITQHQEEVIKDMRRKYEKERMQNMQLFEHKMIVTQQKFDDQLGALQYLPNKVNEMNELNLDNQVSGTLMHRIRFCRYPHAF
jgi:hypothetical protein|tara:strand:+ start:1574 stop:1936 length:363 start_codon:yes stop_codon:yes gene_type:complete